MSFSKYAVSKSNRYIHEEKLREDRKEYIINNGFCYDKTRTPFGIDRYYALLTN